MVEGRGFEPPTSALRKRLGPLRPVSVRFGLTPCFQHVMGVGRLLPFGQFRCGWGSLGESWLRIGYTLYSGTTRSRKNTLIETVPLMDTILSKFFVRCILAVPDKIRYFQCSRPMPNPSREGTSIDPRQMNPETPEENPLDGITHPQHPFFRRSR